MIAEHRYNDRLSPRAAWSIIVLVGLAVLMSMFVIARYRGFWGEGDTSGIIRTNRAVVDGATLIPAGADLAYPNGYAYQAVVTFLVGATGMSLATLTMYGSALLMVWTIVPAWLLFRELTGTVRGAVLGTALLYIQPEYLFPIMRGTHEKFTRGLMLLGLYLLFRSLRSRDDPVRFGALVVAFYMCVYAIFSFNNLLATSYVAGLICTLVIAIIITRITGTPLLMIGPALRRLGYAALISMIFAYILTFHAYRPAIHDVRVIQQVQERIAIVFFGAPSPEKDAPPAQITNPYVAINTGWLSPTVYLTVSLANWLLLASSGLIWATQGILWLLRRRKPFSENEILLWALYGAFGLQGAASIIVDLSGSLAANLQHRMFPSFVMIAAPVTARWMASWTLQNRVVRWAAPVLVGTLVAVLSVLSLFKATNEPLLSNKWVYYQPGEATAITWAETALRGRSLWVAYDERVNTGEQIRRGATPREIKFDQFDVDEGTRDFMISEVTREQAIRYGVPLPVEADSMITYDNGQAQIYHSRPRSPFQR
ncbi:MAG: hypothetical protein IT306_31070 [Chloroflexi bacterium]|nr:hypothetical protein [Chloroflexota bacterium]